MIYSFDVDFNGGSYNMMWLMLVLSMFVILLYNIFYVNCIYKFHTLCVSTLIFYDKTDEKKIVSEKKPP
jgi:membrane protein required for beta-lactamase induction